MKAYEAKLKNKRIDIAEMNGDYLILFTTLLDKPAEPQELQAVTKRKGKNIQYSTITLSGEALDALVAIAYKIRTGAD